MPKKNSTSSATVPPQSTTSEPKKTTTKPKVNPDYKKLLKLAEENHKQLQELQEMVKKLVNNGLVGGSKGEKKKKDPNAPKKNKNGYMFFCDKHRPRVKNEHPGIDGKQLVKILSEEWNSLDDNKRSTFLKCAEADKVRYLNERETYEKTLVV